MYGTCQTDSNWARVIDDPGAGASSAARLSQNDLANFKLHLLARSKRDGLMLLDEVVSTLAQVGQ